MKLVAIQRVHFGRSEHTNYLAVRRAQKLSLARDQVLCLISHGGDQIIFVYGIMQQAGSPPILRSVRLRLTSGARWNPMMLANYAKQVGLTLDSIKTFEEHYRR